VHVHQVLLTLPQPLPQRQVHNSYADSSLVTYSTKHREFLPFPHN